MDEVLKFNPLLFVPAFLCLLFVPSHSSYTPTRQQPVPLLIIPEDYEGVDAA